MYIDRLDWDDYRVEHIARHDVEPREVWEVCNDRSHLARRQGRNRYLVWANLGWTVSICGIRAYPRTSVYKPITARNMTEREKRNFRRLRK